MKLKSFMKVNNSTDTEYTVFEKGSSKTGNFKVIEQFTVNYIHAIEKYGKPENAVMIQSSPFVDKAVKLARYFDYTFTVYSDKEKIENALANGACECNGKKCADCGYKCYMKAWEENANIAEFLRK